MDQVLTAAHCVPETPHLSMCINLSIECSSALTLLCLEIDFNHHRRAMLDRTATHLMINNYGMVCAGKLLCYKTLAQRRVLNERFHISLSIGLGA